MYFEFQYKALVALESSYQQVYTMLSDSIFALFPYLQFQAIFGQVTKILSVNEVLLESLKKGIAEAGGAGFEEMCLIGKVFEQTAPFLKIYMQVYLIYLLSSCISSANRIEPAMNMILRTKPFPDYQRDLPPSSNICKLVRVSCPKFGRVD